MQCLFEVKIIVLSAKLLAKWGSKDLINDAILHNFALFHFVFIADPTI